MKRDSTATGYVFDRAVAGGSFRLACYMASGDIYHYTKNGTEAYVASNKALVGMWINVNITRRGGIAYIYINGEQDASVANTVNLTSTSAELFVGVRHSLINPIDGSIALLRISATAPSADQIKEIYEAEKPLFQENAKCTLNGSSDAVTALAYDDDTELLHVGTSGGRSTFQGLRRVDETSTSTTEIAAQGGLILEETS
jgi:hypothetical protein